MKLDKRMKLEKRGKNQKNVREIKIVLKNQKSFSKIVKILSDNQNPPQNQKSCRRNRKIAMKIKKNLREIKKIGIKIKLRLKSR